MTRGNRGVGIGLLAIAALLVVLTVVLARWKRPAEAEPDVEAALPVVEVLKVALGPVEDTLLISGSITARASAAVPAEKAGAVRKLYVDKGSDVHTGDPLMAVDDRSWQQALRVAEIEEKDARRESVRWAKLRKSGAVADSEFDAIERRLQLAEVQLEQARINLDQCVVRSPFDGRVDARYLELGEYVNEGQTAFRVVDSSALKVVTRIPERDVASVGVGQDIPFSVSSLHGNTFTGAVAFVAEAADTATHAYMVELDVHPPLGQLRPGMIARVAVPRRSSGDVLAVPLAAVVPHKGDHIVFVLQDGVALQRVVRIDRMAGELAVLQGGLEAGELLITKGHRLIQDGSRVGLADDEDTPEEPES